MKKLAYVLIPVFILSLSICCLTGCGSPKTKVPDSVTTGPKPDKEPEVGTMEVLKMK